MLPEVSSTREVPTLGFGTTVAVIGTVNTSPVGFTVTVRVPVSLLPATPGVYSTHTSRSCSPKPSGSGEVTEADSSVNGAVTVAVAVTVAQPRTRSRSARAVGSSSTTLTKLSAAGGAGATCSTVSGNVS